MNENKEVRNDMNEAWDQVGKAVNDATELYLKELETYMTWATNVRREVLDQTIAMGRQMSRMGEAQFAFLARMPRTTSLFGVVPPWTSSDTAAATEKRPGRSA